MKTLSLSLLVVLAATSHAISFDDLQVWAGSGSNRAMIVIDFADGQTTSSFAWGYRWNGTATGEDALRAIVNIDPLLTASYDDFGSFGFAVNTITYGSRTGAYDVNSGRYWSYWNSPTTNLNWSFASTGMSSRQLLDGNIDGWSFSAPNWNASAPSNPIAAVPEPMTLLGLAIGLATLRKARRR
ncbi:MAG: PEP-CTERM sorting domain-containing protein [Armatimonadetes bacterium]|nr:PEP-CTERM sorting domain-containing protein [Armatimonadota bacterium]